MSEHGPLDAAATERIAADAAWLCGIPAPTFHEQARGEAVRERLADLGLAPTVDGIGNVVARVGGDGPALALCAHLDTVFPGLEAVPVVRRGDRLQGCGIGDNALGLAALLHCADALARRPPQAPVVLAATVGEEGLGDLRGVTALLDEEPVRALIAIEGHGVDSLATGGIAAVRFEAVFTGPGGHSWSDRGTGSAVHAALRAGTQALEAGRPAAINVGRVEGGTAVNAIAERATLLVDIRHEDPATVDAAAHRVERALRDGGSSQIDVAVNVVGRRPGGANRPDEPLVALARAARTAVGLGAAEEHLSSTDANAAHARGIPAVGVGVSRGEHAHTEAEWIAVPPIAQGAAALLALVRAADQHC